MTDPSPYSPGPAYGAQAQRNEGDMWTLILVRELRHSPEKVWQALTDPEQLKEWAPFLVDRSLNKVGTVKLTWVGSPQAIETKITRAEAPRLLEYSSGGGDVRWELQPHAGGTRLTMWHSLDRRYISMGAAGWHIAFDVLDHLLRGTPIGRIAGADAIKFPGWQRLNGEYAKHLGTESPKWPPQAAEKF